MQAVIFVGLQASGKSTFYKTQLYRTHIRLNLDMLKTRHRELILLTACIEAKQPFVIDNTNPTAIERARYIVPARAAKFEVIGYAFQSSVESALKHNQGRDAAERVPNVAIYSTAKRLEQPDYTEGFDRLHRVTMDGAGGFTISEWET